MIINTAMILAAGRGTRLKPMTDRLPKALCPVKGIPLIERHVAHLAQAGFKRVIINHAHLGGQIRQHLGNGAHWDIEICYSPEPPGGLETGGGVVNALPLLGEQPFVTVNADIFTDYNFATLKLPQTSQAHLVLVNQPINSQQGDFGLNSLGQLENNPRQFTFSGIACYRPEIFKSRGPGRYSLTPLLRQLVTEQQVTGEVFHGIWFDIGSPTRLELANKA